jgi:hypothetical protein
MLPNAFIRVKEGKLSQEFSLFFQGLCDASHGAPFDGKMEGLTSRLQVADLITAIDQIPFEQVQQEDARGFFIMNMNATGTQTVVIVGTGLAGGNAAVTLRQEGWRGRILLLGTEPTIPFGRPPLIFAAGDVANILHPLFGRVRVEHYNNAEKQGRAAAHALLGSSQPYDYIYSFWSDQYEHKLEYVGYASRWERLVVRGSYESRTFLAFYLTQGIMQAAFGLNRGGDPELEANSELRACQELIGNRVRLSEDALADDGVDLRSLQSAAPF